jgi:putative transposase
MENDDNLPNEEALFRYQVVSSVLHNETLGKKRSVAISTALEIPFLDTNGKLRKVKKRTLYRWLALYEVNGFFGLIPVSREKTSSSVVLKPQLLDFCKTQKQQDPSTSIPELILRARKLDVIAHNEKVDRTTLWRSLKRMDIDTSRGKSPKKEQDCRRFAYPHRMDMILCDGKHFRVGVKRLRRVALFFIDDATRFVLHVVVGTSENKTLFLRGFYECLLKYGLMTTVYLDHGSGFVAGDTINIIKNLNILLIHGSVRYPQGHGKIEKFNQTALNSALRTLDSNPQIDPDCQALELRLLHYLSNQYNQTSHESLGMSPWKRFSSDIKVLRLKESSQQLRDAFVLPEKRLVSKDNVISFKSIYYEIPLGFANTHITLHRQVLDNTLSVLNNGVLMRIHPVDLHSNARAKRNHSETIKDNDLPKQLPKSSAEIDFEQHMSPILDSEGGFGEKE